MFSGLISDSMALGHVWLGLPGGRFQSGGGWRITAATVVCISSTECHVLPNNLTRRFPLPCSKAGDTIASSNGRGDFSLTRQS